MKLRSVKTHSQLYWFEFLLAIPQHSEMQNDQIRYTCRWDYVDYFKKPTTQSQMIFERIPFSKSAKWSTTQNNTRRNCFQYSSTREVIVSHETWQPTPCLCFECVLLERQNIAGTVFGGNGDKWRGRGDKCVSISSPPSRRLCFWVRNARVHKSFFFFFLARRRAGPGPPTHDSLFKPPPIRSSLYSSA